MTEHTERHAPLSVTTAARTAVPRPSLASPRLARAVAQGWERAFYRRHWGARRVDDVLAACTAARFRELPVVRKEHLRAHWGELMTLDGASDIVSSSGTTGRPVDVPLHPGQENVRMVRVQRLLQELGVGPGSRVLQLISLNDLFTLGPLVWRATRALGACAIRVSPCRLERVLQVFQYLRPDVVVGNPFVMTRMAEEAGDRWPERGLLPSRAFLAVAATFDAQLRPSPVARAVADSWGLSLHLNQYGSSELGPIAHECRHHTGLHVHEDHLFVELIDPLTGAPVEEPDRPGEVVVTDLTAPAGFLPIRFATGDMVAWRRTGRCRCGRSSARLGPVIGRIDQQLKLCGQTVFPELLLGIADSTPGVRRALVLAERDPIHGDRVTLMVATADGDRAAEQVRAEIEKALAGHLAVAPLVRMTSLAELAVLEERIAGQTNRVKVPRFIDLRREEARP